MNKHRRRGFDVEFFENAFQFIWFAPPERRTLLHRVDGGADDAVGVAHGVAVDGAVAVVRRGDVGQRRLKTSISSQGNVEVDIKVVSNRPSQ